MALIVILLYNTVILLIALQFEILICHLFIVTVAIGKNIQYVDSI